MKREHYMFMIKQQLFTMVFFSSEGMESGLLLDRFYLFLIQTKEELSRIVCLIICVSFCLLSVYAKVHVPLELVGIAPNKYVLSCWYWKIHDWYVNSITIELES